MKEATRFAELVRESVAAIELGRANGDWDRAVELCARVAERAPRELQQLADLPAAEGVALWLRFTARAASSLTELFDRHRRARAEQDPLDIDRLAALGARLQSAVVRAMKQPVKRTVSKNAKEYRS
jgi:hypothetical protein